jgi:hypothetical protein
MDLKFMKLYKIGMLIKKLKFKICTFDKMYL